MPSAVVRVESPALMAFLRTLAFAGVTEAIFYRLLPPPRASDPLQDLRLSLHAAGDFAFWLALALVLASLLNLSIRTLRHRFWSPGLNGFLAASICSLVALGASLASGGQGPGFVLSFTLLSLLIVLAMATHAASGPLPPGGRSLAVFYCGAIVCSTVGLSARHTARLGWELPVGLQDASLAGGEILLAAAACAAFVAYCEPSWPSVTLGGLAAAGLAAGSLLAPAGSALLGSSPGLLRLSLLSVTLLLGAATAASCLGHPRRLLIGYGLLMLLLAGYPLRIMQQHLLMVLGAALLFVPRRPARTAPEAFLQATDPAAQSRGETEPAAPAQGPASS